MAGPLCWAEPSRARIGDVMLGPLRAWRFRTRQANPRSILRCAAQSIETTSLSLASESGRALQVLHNTTRRPLTSRS
jgi:hypothetical protein